MSIQFSEFAQDERKFLSALINGELYTASSDHPAYAEIRKGVLDGDVSVADKFDVSKVVSEKFARVSERVTLVGGNLYFDGDPEPDKEFEAQVLRFLDGEEDDWKPLVAFREKVAQNPEAHSREQAYRWLNKHNFPIAEDGDVIAYKGVAVGDDGKYLSINSGKARVNGEVITGRIPQEVGDVVEMPRSEVQHDPRRGCHTGLHAGTWEYASNFGRGATLKVKINPRDIVSVPTDSGEAKVRVSRYTVLDATEAPVEALVYRESYYDDYGDEDDYDEPEWGDGEGDDLYDTDGGFISVTTTVPSSQTYSYTTNANNSTAVKAASSRPTALNHLNQPRDAKGHFIKKS